jgi:hypothetical protein
MEPIYSPNKVTPAYQLNWGLTLFWRQTSIPDCEWLDPLKQVAEPDGVRVLRHRVTTRDASQFFISTKPHVAPAQMIRSVKGRLQHLVIVNDHRWMETHPHVLNKLSTMIERVADKYGQRISRVGLLPDHIHMTLGCMVDHHETAGLDWLQVDGTMV